MLNEFTAIIFLEKGFDGYFLVGRILQRLESFPVVPEFFKRLLPFVQVWAEILCDSLIQQGVKFGIATREDGPDCFAENERQDFRDFAGCFQLVSKSVPG